MTTVYEDYMVPALPKADSNQADTRGEDSGQ